MNRERLSESTELALALVLVVTVYIAIGIWNNLMTGTPVVDPLSFSYLLVILLGLGIGTQIRKFKLIEPLFFAALFGLVLYPILEMLSSQITGIPLQELLYHPIPILMFIALVFVLGLGTRGQIERLKQRRQRHT